MSTTNPVAAAHSRVANLAKQSKKDPAAKALLEHARRDLAAEKLAAYIAEVVASAPPLSVDMVQRLSLLLSGAGVVA